MTRVEPKMDFDFERIVSALLTSQGNWHALKTRIDLTISELVFALYASQGLLKSKEEGKGTGFSTGVIGGSSTWAGSTAVAVEVEKAAH